MRRALLPPLLAVGLGAIAAAPASGATPVGVPGDCVHEQVRPRTIVLACADGNYRLRGLRWRRWGGPVALARGAATINDCDPYCAVGHFHNYRVAVALARPARCPGRRLRQYRTVTVRYLGRPPSPERRQASGPLPCPPS